MESRKSLLLLTIINSLLIIVLAGVSGVLAKGLQSGEPPADPAPQVVENPPGDSEQPADVSVALTPLLQYQGRLMNPATGKPVANAVYVMGFRLYGAASGGAALWTETKNVQVTDGLFSTALGDTTSLPQSLFNGQALWLGVTVGADLEAIPRQQILPSAYALSLLPGAVISSPNTTPALTGSSTGKGAVFQTSSAAAGQAGVFGRAGAAAALTPAQESGVFGSAANGNGVSGASTTESGVYGVSQSGYGVRADSLGANAALYALNTGTGYGGYFAGFDNHAIYASGSITATGNVIAAGNVNASGNVNAGVVNAGIVNAAGNINATGNIKASGKVSGQYTSLPIAYGHINFNASLASASSNVTSSVYVTNHYEITISGETYFYTNYITHVTLGYGCGAGNSPRVTSGGGKLWFI